MNVADFDDGEKAEEAAAVAVVVECEEHVIRTHSEQRKSIELAVLSSRQKDYTAFRALCDEFNASEGSDALVYCLKEMTHLFEKNADLCEIVGKRGAISLGLALLLLSPIETFSTIAGEGRNKT